MSVVTSLELLQRFETVRRMAMTEPVSVLHEGGEALVLLSAEEFDRLKAMDTRQTYKIGDLPDEWGEALMSAEPAPECPPS